MKEENIFIGNIMKCTEYNNSVKSITYKKTTIIYIKHLGFIDLDSLSGNTLKDSLNLFKEIISDSNINNEIIMQTIPSTKGSLWVDATSLQPYYYKEQKKRNIKIKQLKQKNKTKYIIH